MASEPETTERGETLAPNLAPRHGSRGNTPVNSEAPRKNIPEHCSPGQRGKKRKHAKPSKKGKKARIASKHRSKSRTYSSSSSSLSSSSSSSDSESSAEEMVETPLSSRRSVTGSEVPDVSMANEIPDSIVAFAADAAFQGLSKSARKAMTHETPVPFHPDLRAKKVDSFLKKFLRRKGANFNTALDRRHLNLAGRILDPLGPLAGLWQIALSAEADNTGVDPSLVIDFVRRTMSLVGNASHCALTDRRKTLLANVSAECLDLVDDKALFVPGTSDMFGKKFKKAVLKELKLAKEMDNLVGASRGKNKPFKPFRQQSGKGPGYNPRSWGQRGWNQTPSTQSRFRGGFSQRKEKPYHFPSQEKQN